MVEVFINTVSWCWPICSSLIHQLYPTSSTLALEMQIAVECPTVAQIENTGIRLCMKKYMLVPHPIITHASPKTPRFHRRVTVCNKTERAVIIGTRAAPPASASSSWASFIIMALNSTLEEMAFR